MADDLYDYEEVKRISDSSSDDEFVVKPITAKRKGRPSTQSVVIKKKQVDIKPSVNTVIDIDNSDEEDLAIMTKSTSSSTSVPKVNVVDEAAAFLEQYKNRSTAVKDIKPPVASEAKVESKVSDAELEQLLGQASKIRQKLQGIETKEQSATTKVQRDKDIPSIVIPVIAKAQVRIINANKEFSSDHIDNLLGRKPSSDPRPGPALSSSSGAPKITLKTRLGTHEWTWKLEITDTFGKLKSSFVEKYGLAAKDVALIFDGEALKDTQTPKGAGMEDEDLIDVKVDKAKVAAAIQFAETNKSAPKSEPPAPALPAKAAPKITLKTRIGTHEWTWKLDETDTFGKLKTSFVEKYGLVAKDVALIFDGEALKDAQTPKGAGIEDEDLIDVKVDKAKVAAAIQFAESNRNAPKLPPEPVKAVAPVPSSSSVVVQLVIAVPASFTVSGEDHQFNLKFSNDIFLHEVHRKIAKLDMLASTVFAFHRGGVELDLSKSVSGAGIADGEVITVEVSPVIEIQLDIIQEDDPTASGSANVKVSKYQECGVMMKRIAGHVQSEHLLFTFDGNVLHEEDYFGQYNIVTGSKIKVLVKTYPR